MKRNIGVAGSAVLLLALFSIAGCNHATGPTNQLERISMRVDGDGQIGIEYSYDDALYGKQAGSIVSQPGVGWEAKGLVLRGSTYRLYALSTASNGHVAASVVVIADSDGRTLLSVSKQNDGGSVEITGTVP